MPACSALLCFYLQVEVVLIKAAADGNWPTIEGSGKRPAPAASTTTSAPTEPAKVERKN